MRTLLFTLMLCTLAPSLARAQSAPLTRLEIVSNDDGGSYGRGRLDSATDGAKVMALLQKQPACFIEAIEKFAEDVDAAVSSPLVQTAINEYRDACQVVIHNPSVLIKVRIDASENQDDDGEAAAYIHAAVSVDQDGDLNQRRRDSYDGYEGEEGESTPSSLLSTTVTAGGRSYGSYSGYASDRDRCSSSAERHAPNIYKIVAGLADAARECTEMRDYAHAADGAAKPCKGTECWK